MIFLYIPADDESVDPMYEMRLNNYAQTGIHIQCAGAYGGGYMVNECGGEGADFWLRHIADVRTLAKAKAIAIAYYEKRKQAA